MLCLREKRIPTFTCHKPRTTRDGITSLGEAVSRPGEVNTAVEMLGLFLHLLCKTFCCPRVCMYCRTPQNSLLLQLISMSWQTPPPGKPSGEDWMPQKTPPWLTFSPFSRRKKHFLSRWSKLQGRTQACALSEHLWQQAKTSSTSPVPRFVRCLH